MKKSFVLILCVCLVALLASSLLNARETTRERFRANTATPVAGPAEIDPGLRSFYQSSAVDTYTLVNYSFEPSSWQGWTRQDMTAQIDTFFHVDNFSGLGGGSFGRLVPLEGTKSMWCGVRANSNDPYLCGWLSAPGYGNDWVQNFGTAAFSFAGTLTLSYHGVFDSEAGYDYTYVQYDAGGGNWQTVATYDNVVDTVATDAIVITQARTKIRFHFVSDGGYSDQDGNWNSDGAAILDEIRLRDSGGLINNLETFEAARVGATDVGIWHARPGDSYGLYSGLRSNLIDKDPCGDNLSTQVVFFLGSPNPSASYPGLYDTPFCHGGGGVAAPCQNEMIISPVIDMRKFSTARNNVQNGTIPAEDLPLLGGLRLFYTVYRDLALGNLVFYTDQIRMIDGTCPGQWKSDLWVWYGANMDYIFSWYDYSHLVGPEPLIQIGIGCVDMCDIWYLEVGNCATHTPSPWIDQVRLVRYKTSGPQWSYREMETFQDNFPDDEFNVESYVRADMGNDVNQGDNPVNHPGDSIVFQCTSPLGGGIALDNGHPAIYLHVRPTYIGRDLAKPEHIAGPQMQGSVGWYVSDDAEWTTIQCDSSRASGATILDWYAVDLNDSLFTRGYKVEYYFTARDNAGAESTFPTAHSAGLGFTNDPPYLEFTCLPTQNSDILYVNDFGGRPDYFHKGVVRAYWEPVFNAVLPVLNQPDVYDVLGAASGTSNGPGSRARTKQLTDQYNIIVWDAGNLSSITISDGTPNSDKSNDCQMLVDWMSLSEHQCGLWILGDDVASDLNAMGSTPAVTLMNTWCGVDFVADSYFDLTGGRMAGGVVNPLMTGDPAGIFSHGGVGDKFSVFGGCAIINAFDVLDKTANGAYAVQYPVYRGTPYYSGIQSESTNSANFAVRTVWFGFSYQYVRDNGPAIPEDRFEIAKDVFNWFQTPTNIDVSPAETPKSNSLAQNFPNPFNPSTSIKFDLKDKGFVTLKVYNVAGELVRTLVNGTKDAGSYTIVWDGMNDRGSTVASGIYFYKMDTNNFSQTRKMVMLR